VKGSTAKLASGTESSSEPTRKPKKWRRVHDDWECACWRYETSGNLWAEVLLDKKQSLYTQIRLGVGHGKDEQVTSKPAFSPVRSFSKAKSLALEFLVDGML
jgi:hypothetical protein